MLESVRADKRMERRRFKRADCPGGIGSFGFNSYDLLTLMVLSFNIVGNAIVNTNKNENNNNNNDQQASLGTINTNENSVVADQTNMNMAIITVLPSM